jgi:hypothetical protein
MADHVRVEMAALAGIDLQCGNAGRANSFGVATGLLVALDDGHRQPRLQQLDGAAEQAGLSRTGAGNQLSAKIPCSSKRRRFAAA